MRQYFGTDGIRGRVGESPMTPDFAMKLGWAAGKVLGSEGISEVVIGKDTRASNYMLEPAMDAGFSAAGVNIALVGPLPTPAIAYLATTFRASVGVVISVAAGVLLSCLRACGARPKRWSSRLGPCVFCPAQGDHARAGNGDY